MTDTSVLKKMNITLPRGFDWPAALLLMAAMLTAATRLAATRWTADLSLVQTVTMLGVIAGLALGASRFSPRAVVYFATMYGLFVVPWQLGLMQQDEALWTDRLASLGYRLGVVIYQLIHKQTVMDSLLFLALMGVLFWFLGAYAGYSVVRHGDAWKTIVPTGLALFVIQYFDPAITRRAWYLAFFIFFGLVLVARLAFVHERARWQRSHTALPPHLSLDFIRFAVAAAGLIVVGAWTAPTLARSLPAAEKLWEPVRTRWNESVDELNYAFASLRSTRQLVSAVYGNSAVLGRGVPLGNARMFSVDTPLNAPAGTRYYWRARSYDIYQDGLWYSSNEQTADYSPEDGDLQTPPLDGRWSGEFRFTSGMQLSTLFAPSELTFVSREGRLQYLDNGDGTLDLSSFLASPSLGPGQIYTVRASISAPTIDQLRQAGQDYPAWVTQRYLQLPANITQRTRSLAEQITAGIDNPYDQVMAITTYLRENITYVESIEGNPTPGQEPMDWFLFDLQQGFCNYYSTAQIVMLRSLGIPARWSIGYAQGELLVEEEAAADEGDIQLTYIVRNLDAHSWPEVYFPGTGWVEFEPTVSQPDLVRPATNSTAAGLDPNSGAGLPEADKDNPNSPVESEAAAEALRSTLLGLLYGFAMLVGLACLAVAAAVKLLPMFGYAPAAVLFEQALARLGLQSPEFVQRWARQAAAAPPPKRIIRLEPLPIVVERTLLKLGARPPAFIRKWASYAGLPPLARAYHEINRALERLGSRPAATATPTERAGALAVLVPPADDPAHQLVGEYQIEMFSPRPADVGAAQESARSVRRLSYRAWADRLLRRFQRSDDEKQLRRLQK